MSEKSLYSSKEKSAEECLPVLKLERIASVRYGRDVRTTAIKSSDSNVKFALLTVLSLQRELAGKNRFHVTHNVTCNVTHHALAGPHASKLCQEKDCIKHTIVSNFFDCLGPPILHQPNIQFKNF